MLSKAIAGASNEAFASSAINANYADTGLVGVLLAAPARSAGKLVEGAVKVLKSGNVSDADVTRGKSVVSKLECFEFFFFKKKKEKPN